MNTPPPIVSRVCTTLLGTPALSTERLKAGPRTAVYRVRISNGRTVIVKLYAHTARRNAITEATAIRSVTGTVPVPRILGWGTTSADGATALITSDLGTRTLGSAVRSGRVTHAQALKDLGALLSRLHRVPVAPSVPRRPFFDAFSFLTRRCPSELLNQIAPALAVIADAPDPTSAVWCHGDIHFDNVVLHGLRDRCHLIDFTDAAPGRRESDVAHALVMTATHTPWDRRALIGAYPAALNQARLSAWVVLHTVRCLVHSAPGEDHALWSSRLADLTQQTPHLFRTPRSERTAR
jgi:Ser/Thr protein kinase RdoA (MazF antagonist)